MRTATLVLIGYAILLIVGASWQSLPGPLPELHPEIAAVVSAYLGLTARRSIAAAVGGSIAIGYLADLLGGTPIGMYSFVSGLVCIFAHLAQRRILVRGLRVTVGFSLFVGLTSALLVPIVRLVNFQPRAPLGTEALRLLGAGAATALVGPMMLRLFRRIDAAFARTHRERDAALEGIVTLMLVRGSSSAGPAIPDDLNRRLKWVVLIGVLAFGGLIFRLWQLQVVRGDRYYQRTVSNVVHEKYLPSLRGRILDRNGVSLADNLPMFDVYATPNQWTPEIRAQLTRLLGLTEEELAKVDEKLEAGRKRAPKQPALILQDQGRDRGALVEQAAFQMPGVEVRNEPFRYYPQKDLAAHLVGYMSQMTEAEYDRLAALGYDPSDLVGRYGLEAEWENYLRGKKGVERFAVDARGERITGADADDLIQGDKVVEPVAGYDVVLTLDAQLQKLAERAVADYKASAVAIVEVDTGRVLALVSKPSFDPNVMTGHLTRAEEALLRADPAKPFVDKTLAARYPPGSTYKIVTAIAALEDGVASEEEPIVCNGLLELSGTKFKCTAAHGTLDLVGAIQHSCNIYFWTLAQRIGMDRMAEVAHEYGFGTPTGLGLNGDASGRVPTKAWYEQKSRFKIGNTINAATGQGDVEVTVMQMAMAYAALANGGTLYVPQVVDRVEARGGGRVVVSYDPKAARHIDTPPEVLDVLDRGMWKVVNEPGGTAFDHAHSDVVIYAGKTGTAEVRTRKKDRAAPPVDGWYPTRSHAWFAGWAPADDPEIAIVVLIEHGGPGGKIAAPVARTILEGWWTKVRNAPATPAPPVEPAP